MNRWLVMLALAWLVPLAARAAEIPATSDSLLEETLALAGANRAELQEALDWCRQKPHAMQAMRFVIANSPLADLGKLTGEELVANYELALAARQQYGYGQHYDEANWAHFVLPLRMSQEPLSAWRPYMYEQLMPLVKDAPTLEDAALIVNAWCGERVRFQQTQRRDQGPLVTLAGGYGRCEELVMLFVCACRAVGVPARQAYCPWWATMDNNHAWAEVLGSDGKWHFTGGCEPAKALDIAWFAGTAKQAPIVISPCFGIPENTSGLEVLRSVATPGARYCQLNSTAFYRETGVLSVDLTRIPSTIYPGDWSNALDFNWIGIPTDESMENPPILSSPEVGLFICVKVFNYGALREIAKVPVHGGKAQVRLGVGRYIVSVSSPLTERSGTEDTFSFWLTGEDAREAQVEIEANKLTSVDWATAERLKDGAILSFPPDPQRAAE